MLSVLVAILVGAVVLGGAARGVGKQGDQQRTADLAALAGAKKMHTLYTRLFEPPVRDGRPNPFHLEKARYLRMGVANAKQIAHANGAKQVSVVFPDRDSFAPSRIRIRIGSRFTVKKAASLKLVASAEAELVPPNSDGLQTLAGGGGYEGPLAYRQGKPMQPDVAVAFDRMDAAARQAGHQLVITSAFRSDAAQAVLWQRHPDPKWVAPPGKSLHRLGTELDLGPSSAYAWLAANAKRFHFVRRYAWEAWHFGYVLNAQSTPRSSQLVNSVNGGERSRIGDGYSTTAGRRDGSSVTANFGQRRLPSFVPEKYRAVINHAAQRWNVSSILLSAQLYVESNFNPNAVSSAGALGIAQFMPGTARSLGLVNPTDPNQAINAQAHLMRDHLRRFGSVPLALAAYNAGPGAVGRCACIPPYRETRAYVAKILGLMNGAGEITSNGSALGLSVRLVA